MKVDPIELIISCLKMLQCTGRVLPLELTPEFSILRLEIPFVFRGTMKTEIPFAVGGPVRAAMSPTSAQRP